ncbi:FAD-dependent oxidoreductase [Gulosibacter molinativorax]|uniref:FAD-dependent oxidoreductase n=1 Tax=Gulosibacter molinativorax TaxID=256821 RepID=A0ABT7C6R5_9MICO|nr:FAD-dependent oxidoreductase [Gulosibacter molinativorax]
MLDVVIIGAGQAGLTAAYWLKHRGLEPWRDFVVLDRNEGPGGAWRHRWPELTLGKAHGIHDLPGMKLGEPDPNEPAAVVVTRYYGEYEQKFGLPIERPVKVDEVRSFDPGSKAADAASSSAADAASSNPHTAQDRVDYSAPLEVRAGDRVWRTKLVINATGTWTKPFVPYAPGAEQFEGLQLRTVDYWCSDDFTGKHVVVVGGGMSAVQFILMLEKAGATTSWSTRREPDWVEDPFDERWGVAVEERVDARASQGLVPHSVVRNTGIPPWPEYVAARDRGRLVSDGPIDHIEKDAVVFESGKRVDTDVILWATGFRPDLDHLAPLHLREPGGGVKTTDVVKVNRDPRILLVGYGASASTVGATRAGRRAALTAIERLEA